MKLVRPWGVSDCGSSPTAAFTALGSRTSSTIVSSWPRHTATEPQTFCAHSPAETVSSRESWFADQRSDREHEHDADDYGDDPA